MKIQKPYQTLFLGLCFSGVVYATPDVAAGKEKAGMCFACHGVEGNSKNANFPTLAGQKPDYIANQLRAFRKGARKNGMMQNMAANMTDAEINNLAAYFASVKNKSAGGDSKLVAEGKAKASICFGCHGDKATGMVAPRLAGQQSAYLQRQLQAFKDGSRKNSLMSGIAKMLSDEDIKSVTEYMGSLK